MMLEKAKTELPTAKGRTNNLQGKPVTRSSKKDKSESKETVIEDKPLTKEELDKIRATLHDLDPVDLCAKKNVIEEASWWDWLNFTWTRDLIQMGIEGKSIKLEHLGGLQKDLSLAVYSKKLEDVYTAQPAQEKNIFYAGL